MKIIYVFIGHFIMQFRVLMADKKISIKPRVLKSSGISFFYLSLLNVGCLKDLKNVYTFFH